MDYDSDGMFVCMFVGLSKNLKDISAQICFEGQEF